MIDIQALKEKLVIPEEHDGAVIFDSEADFLYNFISEHGYRDTLEIGLAAGKSTCYIMAASGSRHVALDPWQEKDFRNAGLENVYRLGMKNRLEFYQEFSHAGLPKLLAGGRQFDFIFIDGSHLFDHTIVDFHFSDLLLRENGYLLFHDYWLRGIAMVDSFIRKNRKEYKRVKIPSNNMVMFRKTGTDQRQWDHFHEFYTLKSIMKHHIFYCFFDSLFSGKKDG